MRGNILEEMLLIQEPSVFKLYQEMMKMAGYFIAPVFTIALLIEYFGEMNFGVVVKKLLLITVFMGCFYEFHFKAVELSLETASYTLKKVSPRNLFVKKWFNVKVRTKEQKQWSFLESFAIPNLNDIIATGFFLMAKVFIWLLKLIYSSVYHLTYVFSGLTAILYFLGWTKDAIKGTFQASLWCMFLPFVIVAILALVGNSIDETALSGGLIVAKIDTIIWLFGVTLLLLISPVITFGMVKGEGIHSFGSKMGAMVVSSGLKAAALAPFITAMPGRVSHVSTKVKGYRDTLKDRFSSGNTKDLKSFSGTEKVESSVKESRFQGKSDSALLKKESKSPQNPAKEIYRSKEAPTVRTRPSSGGHAVTKSQVQTKTLKGGVIKEQQSKFQPSSNERRTQSTNQGQKKDASNQQRSFDRLVKTTTQKVKSTEVMTAPRREKREQLR
jgi:hypothetical protein